jgi:hypothetical protein
MTFGDKKVLEATDVSTLHLLDGKMCLLLHLCFFFFQTRVQKNRCIKLPFCLSVLNSHEARGQRELTQISALTFLSLASGFLKLFGQVQCSH